MLLTQLHSVFTVIWLTREIMQKIYPSFDVVHVVMARPQHIIQEFLWE